MSTFYIVSNLISLGYKVHERHSFLTRLLGVTRPEEDESYTNMIRLLTWVPVCTVLFSVGEVAMFFVYNFKVMTYKVLLKLTKDFHSSIFI